MPLNKHGELQLLAQKRAREPVSSPTSSTEARAQGAESDSEGRGEPRRTGKPRLPPVEHSGCGRLRNTQTRPPTRDSPLSRSPPPKRMPERSAPATHVEHGTVSTSKNDNAYKTEHSHDRKRLQRRPGCRPGRQSSTLSWAAAKSRRRKSLRVIVWRPKLRSAPQQQHRAREMSLKIGPIRVTILSSEGKG